MTIGLSEQAKKIFFRKKHLQDVYQQTFESATGKEVLLHLCKVANIFDSTVVRGDPYETYLNEGARRLVLSIINQLNLDLEKILELQREVNKNVDFY